MGKHAEHYTRPIMTRYFATIAIREHSKSGAASTEKGAIRAAVPRVFMQEYEKAVIIDRRTGAVLYTIKALKGQIRMSYGNDAGLGG